MPLPLDVAPGPVETFSPLIIILLLAVVVVVLAILLVRFIRGGRK